MSQCFGSWPLTCQEARIKKWLTSLPPAPSPSPSLLPTDLPRPNRVRKRTEMPTTPPSLNENDEHSTKRRRLSGGQEVRDEEEAEQTTPRQRQHDQPDTAESTLAIHQRPTPEAGMSSQCVASVRRAAPMKRSIDLQSLEVPIFLEAMPEGRDVKEKLPADIFPLYTSIRSVAFHHKAFIPNEIRHKIEELYGDDMQASWFQASQENTAAQKQAEAELEKLQSLLSDALECKRLSRYEDAWNAEVHLPMLKLALGCNDSDTNATQPPRVAPELVTSAVISVDSIPRVSILGKRRLGSQGDESSILACSISQSGASSTNSSASELFGEPHSKKGSKKVDLAIVLDPALSSCLKDAITYARQGGSVNQSTYGPLRERPIACAIETKITPSSTDPVVQLGVWTLAWYRRMDTLWRASYGPGGDITSRGRMVSLPLITIVDHTWSIYFAVDQGDRITIFGPEYMGSTSKLDTIYIIHACLRLIQGWAQSDFYAFLGRWFCQSQS